MLVHESSERYDQSTILIAQRGDMDEITIKVKQKLQSNVLSKVSELAMQGKWHYQGFDIPILLRMLGLKYLDESLLNRQLDDINYMVKVKTTPWSHGSKMKEKMLI